MHPTVPLGTPPPTPQLHYAWLTDLISPTSPSAERAQSSAMAQHGALQLCPAAAPVPVHAAQGSLCCIG